MHHAYFRSLLLALACSAAACQGERGDSSTGTAFAELRGEVTKDPTSSASHVKAVLVWANFAKNGDTFTTVEAPITGSFPAPQFTFDLREPPADEALNDFTHGGRFPKETRVATGTIYAVAADVDLQKRKGPKAKAAGVVERHVVVYVERDVQAGTKTAKFLHGTLTKGYHLMEVIPADESNGEIHDQLHEAAGGLDIPLELKLADDGALDHPNFY